jgi:hypothetical protein
VLSDGGANRDRTDDLLHAMQALYQLSYGPLTSDVLTDYECLRKNKKADLSQARLHIYNKRNVIIFLVNHVFQSKVALPQMVLQELLPLRLLFSRRLLLVYSRYELT